MTCISQAEVIVQKSIHEVDNPAISAVTCTPGMELICVKFIYRVNIIYKFFKSVLWTMYMASCGTTFKAVWICATSLKWRHKWKEQQIA